MFIGPLFWKEILEGLKRKRTYIFRGVFVGFLFLSLLVVWPSRTEFAAGFGDALVKLLFWIQFLLIAVITPVLTATTITAEKDAGSLELLLLTRFSSSEIILGKFFSRTVQLQMLLLCALPVISLVINIGGVDLRTILSGFALITALVPVCGMAGIWCAIRYRRVHTAALASYFIIALVLYPLPQGLKYILPEKPAQTVSVDGGPALALTEIELAQRQADSLYSPPMALQMVLAPPPGVDVSWTWVRPAALSGICALLLFWWSTCSLRYAATRANVGSSAAMQRVWNALAGFRNAVAGGGDLDREIDRGNPVIWREIRMRTLPNSIATMMAYLAAFLGVGLVAFAATAQGSKGLGLHTVLAVSANGAIALGATVLAATAFVREKEGRTMQTLLTSLLTGREIIEGKEEGLRRCLRLGVCFLIIYVCVLALFDPFGEAADNDRQKYVNIGTAISTAVMSFFCVRFYIVQALYWSMKARSTAFAMVIALLCSVIQLFIGYFVPFFAFLNPVGCGVFWTDSVGGTVFLIIGLGVSYMLYRWLVAHSLHKMLVAFQRSVQEAR